MTVTYTPDVIAEPVADLAVGLVIAVMRRICEADRYVRAGQWQQKPMSPGTGLSGKICGIVGLGRIGSRLATIARAFDMRVVGVKRDPSRGGEAAESVVAQARMREVLPGSPGL